MYSSQFQCIGSIQKSPSVSSCPTAQTVKKFLFGGTRLKNLVLKFGLTGKWKMLSKSWSFSQLPARNQLGTVSCSQSCVRQRAAGAREPCRAWLLPSEAEPQLPWEQRCSPAPASSFSAPQLICHCPPSTEAQKQTPLNRETPSTVFFGKCLKRKDKGAVRVPLTWPAAGELPEQWPSYQHPTDMLLSDVCSCKLQT